MPILLMPDCSRRAFLKTAALSAGALLTGGCAHLMPRPPRSLGATRWAFLSDIHTTLDDNELQRGFRINDNLRKAVAQSIEAQPDAMMITGDLARLEGREGDYRMLRDILEPARAKTPIALVLGNHDDRKVFYKQFTEHHGVAAPVENKHVRVIDLPAAGIRFIGLDSLLYTNRTSGYLGGKQRQWLADTLDASPKMPTLLFLHHTFGDNEGRLLDTDSFFQILEPRKQVKAVFFGHSHEYAYDERKGIHLINIPAIGYSFDDKEPVGWLDGRLTAEGGDLTLRAFASNTTNNGKTTSLAWR